MGMGGGPRHTWLWWACLLWHAVQRSLPEPRGPGGQEAGGALPGTTMFVDSVLSGYLVCLRVDGLEGDHSDCSEDPPQLHPSCEHQG